MKKIALLLSSLMLVFALTACGVSAMSDPASSTPAPQSSAGTPGDVSAPASQSPDPDVTGSQLAPANASLVSGQYNAVGDYEETQTPYLLIDTEKNELRFGLGSTVKYQECGTYQVEDGVLVAPLQSTTFRFEIKDAKTLVLIDGYHSRVPNNTQFVLCDNQ